VKLQGLAGYAADQIRLHLTSVQERGTYKNDGSIERFVMPLGKLFPRGLKVADVSEVTNSINSGLEDAGFADVKPRPNPLEFKLLARVFDVVEKGRFVCVVETNNLDSLIRHFPEVAEGARDAGKRRDWGIEPQDFGRG
jgi:hypothetical protein